MIISLILAMDEHRVIGHAGRLPWHLPADLQYFKQVTMGKPILMGRRTHDSIGKPLPGRTNVVMTRDRSYTAPGCVVAHSVDEAIEAAADAAEVMVIGGAQLYQQFLPLAGRIYLTKVHATVAGDTYFSPLRTEEWRQVSRSDHAADARNPYAYSFVVLERQQERGQACIFVF